MLSPLQFGSVFVPKEYLAQAGLPSLADPAMMEAPPKEIHESAKRDPLPLKPKGQFRNEGWEIYTVSLIGSRPNRAHVLEAAEATRGIAGGVPKDEYVGGVILQTEDPVWLKFTTRLGDAINPQRLRGTSHADESLVKHLEAQGVPKEALTVKHIIPLNDDVYEPARQLAKQ